MSPKSMLRTALRLFIVAALIAGTMPLATAGADARGGRAAIGASKGAIIHNRLRDKDQEEEAATEADETTGKAAEDATAAESSDADSDQTVARAQSIKPVDKATRTEMEDANVQGCAPGMICTVCIAGCLGPVDGIIYAERKPQR